MSKFSKFPAGIKSITSVGKIIIEDLYLLIRDENDLKCKTIHYRKNVEPQYKYNYKTTHFEYVTFGGVFPVRKDSELKVASGLICLDVDKIQDPERIKMIIIEKCDFAVLIFVSPSGNGLKIVFKTNPNFPFVENYTAYSKYLAAKFDVPYSAIDKSCASISKACFLCHDPKVYLNPNWAKGNVPYIGDEMFPIQPITLENENVIEQTEWVNLFESSAFLYSQAKLDFEKQNSVENFKILCRICLRKKGKFEEGKRHSWVLHLASLCNGFGMEREKAISYFKNLLFSHPAIYQAKNPFDVANDLERPFQDVYEKFKGQFGTWIDNADEFETPYIPDAIYDHLPLFIQKQVKLFENKRERDIFLLGMLTLLSTCFPMVQGVYKQRRVRANLYLFVCAPPGSGKGCLADIRTIGNDIHQSFINRYRDELERYNALPDEEKKKEMKPKMMKFFIPANNTSAKIIQSIDVNTFFGILMDTEADTLTNANKSEHGHFSEILRKGFHHESIEYERKLNDEYICINNPAFSILLSGTPNQIQRLVLDVENGLTSRFLYYSFTSKEGWKDVFSKGEDLSYVFKSASAELYSLVTPFLFDFISNPESVILFDLTENQKEVMQDWFSEKVKCLEGLYGPEINASVYRLGLIVFRIAMILAIVRKAETIKHVPVNWYKSIVCTDVDFDTAMEIISPLLCHSVSIYNSLKKNGKAKKFHNQKQNYITNLPSEFNFQTATTVAGLLNINEKTAENYLSWAVGSGLLEKVKHNHYKKNGIE